MRSIACLARARGEIICEPLFADNKIAQNAGWDRELLAAELPELAEILIVENLDISITGFARSGG